MAIVKAVFLSMLLAHPAHAATRADLERVAVETAARHGIPPALLLGVCQTESNWEPHALGDGGASFGVCQIQIGTGLPILYTVAMCFNPRRGRRETMRRVLMTPAANIHLAAVLLRTYIDRFGDETLAVMAYNGGPDHPLLKHWLKVREAKRRYEEKR